MMSFELSQLSTVITNDKGSYSLAIYTQDVFALGAVEAVGGPDHALTEAAEAKGVARG